VPGSFAPFLILVKADFTPPRTISLASVGSPGILSGEITVTEARMSWFGSLKLSTKFNLIMSCLLIVLFLAAALLIYKRQQTLILKVAIDNARNIAKQIIETRDYMSSVVRGEPEGNYSLVPQVVATQVAKRMTKGSKYYVRQVSLRYRNPENRPDDYETRQLREFAGKVVKETYTVVRVKREQSFRYMQSMVAEKSCLGCHGSYEEAPQFIRTRFPRGHYSYNYKLGEVIGAVSVTVPMAELYREIGTNLKVDLVNRGGIFLLIIVIMGTLIRRTIINPIRMLSESITRVTKTGSFSERLVKKSDDEIGQLITAFNEMMEELDRKTAQSRESEERYRKFIEIAKSAVITFMQDGKIVITNQKAEELFGLSRQELLGEIIFNFFEDGEKLREAVAEYLRGGKESAGAGPSIMQRVRNVNGVVREVEVALSATHTDQQPMITVILREIPATKQT
jgi:PAS domain S-box-containing protein